MPAETSPAGECTAICWSSSSRNSAGCADPASVPTQLPESRSVLRRCRWRVLLPKKKKYIGIVAEALVVRGWQAAEAPAAAKPDSAKQDAAVLQTAVPSDSAAGPYCPHVTECEPSEYGERAGYKSKKLAKLLSRLVSSARPHALLCLRETWLHDSAPFACRRVRPDFQLRRLSPAGAPHASTKPATQCAELD